MKNKALTLGINEENYNSVIKKAVDFLRKGRIIIYPTETSYGIGAEARNRRAIEKIHIAKKQPKNKPVSIIVSSLAVAKKFGKISKEGEKLVNAFMPGPLTLIVEKRKSIPEELSRSGIAFRISSNKIANDLCKRLGTAITATSANLHGEKEIYDSKKIIKKFYDKVDLIIDAGKLPKRKVSTLYDVEGGKVIRRGKISEEEIKRVLHGKKYALPRN